MELTFAHFNYKTNLKQQRDLFKDCFPETYGDPIQSEKHYLWKFHSFPYVIHSWEYASYLEKELVGYYAAIPYRYKIGKTIINVGMVCDVMTSSRYRGKGIFTKTGRFSTEELSTHVPFTMGYPRRKEVIPGHLKVGWKIAFNMPLYIKFLRLNALLKSKRIGFIAPLANVFLSLYNGIARTKINKDYACSIFTDIEKVEGFESFASQWSDSIENSLIKDMSFVRWRYAAPERKYKFISVLEEDKMIGFVAFRRIIEEGVPSYGILDYMVLPGHEDCHGIINKTLSDCARKDRVEAIMTMMSKTSAFRYQLIKNGYIRSPIVFSMIIKNFKNNFNDEDLIREEKWHLMWVDSDDL